MKCLVFILLCTLFSLGPCTDLYYDLQHVDHFDPQVQEKWSQRYIVTDKYYKDGGPIFLFLGGEAEITFFEFQEVSSKAWAEEFSGLYIELEHRYYGKSFPVPDLSTKNLKYLSSQQALADAADFLEWFNATQAPKGAGPWIVLGCSYSGSLAAWFREKYPQLVIGAIAPSGPIFAEQSFLEFLNQWSVSAPSECVDAVEKATGLAVSMFSNETGRAELSALFNSCQPISSDDMYMFFYALANDISELLQFHNPPDWPMTAACETLTAGLSAGDYLKNWAVVRGTKMCSDFTEKGFIDAASYTELTSQSSRQWWYQSCAEFGWFSTSSPGSSPFYDHLNVEVQQKWCEKIFGIPGFIPDIDFTNEYYGGWDIQGTEILFANGNFDPWHRISITKRTGQVDAVTYEAGHCGVMIAPTDSDPESLRNARNDIRNFIRALLS